MVNESGNPQKEDGYTPIANELYEAILCADFSKRQLLVLLSIARMTYGYNKKSDALSTVQIANMTGINRPKVSETLKELIEMNVIQKLDSGRSANGHFVNEILINKKYKTWILTGTNSVSVDDEKTGTKTVSVDRYQNGTGTKTGTGTNSVSVTGTKMGIGQVPKRDTHKEIKTINKYIPKKTLIPDDFSISERVRVWANEKRYLNLQEHLESFTRICKAKGYQYVDWDSAFMEAIRKNWAKIDNVPEKKQSEWPEHLRRMLDTTKGKA